MSPTICSSACAECWMMPSARRWSSSRRVWPSTSTMPVTPMMGVRISWLMAARKALLARLASRARCSLSRNSLSSSLISVRSVATASRPSMSPVSLRMAETAMSTGTREPSLRRSVPFARRLAQFGQRLQHAPVGGDFAVERGREARWTRLAIRRRRGWPARAARLRHRRGHRWRCGRGGRAFLRHAGRACARRMD